MDTELTGRYFLAIELPEDVKKWLKRNHWKFLEKFQKEKTVPTHQWHLTLAFLGKIPKSKEATLFELFEKWTLKNALDLTLKGFGAFPNVTQSKILYAKITDNSGELEEFREKMAYDLQTNEIPFDQKDFIPHLTLARLRFPKNLTKSLEGTEKVSINFSTCKLYLFESFQNKNPYGIVKEKILFQ